MDPVVHFEMPYMDRQRAVDFYAKAFGWKAQLLGAEMGNYAVMQTGETDANNMMVKPGMINGGMYQRTEDPATHFPSVVIAVENIDEAMKRVTDAGGKVVSEAMPIPGVGTFASVIDTEGNRVSILQPLAM